MMKRTIKMIMRKTIRSKK